ncbi:hypothetical protein [Streptomyces coeruleorubidus]|uniref:hypothetical protein n=1 Tax=Streptomyces coeruleorubidus TaxID=116188 RepID=UPI00365787ED
MSVALVRRPTEEAAVAAASRKARPLPSLPAVLTALDHAHRSQDRAGARLFAHLAVRVALPEVGE